MASNMLVWLGVGTQLELHSRRWTHGAHGSGFEWLSTAPLILTFRLVWPMMGATAEVMLPPAFDPHTLGLAAPLCVDAKPPRCARYVLVSAICKGPVGQYFCMFDSDGTAGASWGGDTSPPFRLGHELVGTVYVLETHLVLASDGSVSRNTVAQSPDVLHPAAETCSILDTAVGTLCAPCGDSIGIDGVTLCCTHRLCETCWRHAVAFAVWATPTALRPETCKVVCPVCAAFSLVNPERVKLVAQQITDSQGGPSRNGSRGYFSTGPKATPPGDRQARHASALAVHLSLLLAECPTPPEISGSVAAASALEIVEAAHRGVDKRPRPPSGSPQAADPLSADSKRLRLADAQARVPATPALAQGDQQDVPPPAEPNPASTSGQSQAPEQLRASVDDGSPLGVLVAAAEGDRSRPPSEKTDPPLSEWLQTINLQHALPALQELGAARVTDLLDLEGEDMASLNLKVLEAR